MTTFTAVLLALALACSLMELGKAMNEHIRGREFACCAPCEYGDHVPYLIVRGGGTVVRLYCDHECEWVLDSVDDAADFDQVMSKSENGPLLAEWEKAYKSQGTERIPRPRRETE